MEKHEGVNQKLFTPKEVMAQFQITRPTLANWCRKKALKKISIPGMRRVYITAESVNKLLANG